MGEAAATMGLPEFQKSTGCQQIDDHIDLLGVGVAAAAGASPLDSPSSQSSNGPVYTGYLLV